MLCNCQQHSAQCRACTLVVKAHSGVCESCSTVHWNMLLTT